MPESAEFVTQITKSQRQLHAFILSLVWNPVEADEVLQETNLVLWQKADLFDQSRPFLPWAMRFAQFQTVAWLKRHRKQKERFVFDNDLIMQLAEEYAMEEPVFESRRVALAGCLKKLQSKQRAMISQRYQPNASVNEMALAEGITPKAMSDRLRRVRQALMTCIEKAQVTESYA